VLYVGRIERSSAWKGIATLLDAMATVVAARPGVRLRMVGAGDAVEQHLDHASRLGIRDLVDFTGPLAGQDLARAYSDASVLVLPSETEAEAFGMVLIEALACGTAVVGTAVGGPPHVIADTAGGLVVPPRDPAALAAALMELLDDDARRSGLARRGREAVLARYTWSTVVDSYEAIIDQVSGRH
jgi:rhamnosyl/mannosyltransferase